MIVRLSAYAGERERTVLEAERFAAWLESEGWFDEALKFYDFASNLIAQHGLGAPKARIRFLLSKARLSLILSRIDTCRETLDPILKLTHAYRDHSGAVQGLLLLGQLAMQQDDIDEARQYIDRAVLGAESLQDPRLLGTARIALARWLDRYGDPLASQQQLDSAFNLFDQAGYDRVSALEHGMLLNRATRIYAGRGLVQRATHVARELTVLAHHSASPMLECRAAWARAAVLRADNRFSEAADELMKAEAKARHYSLTSLAIVFLRERAIVALASNACESAIRIADDLVDLAQRHQDIYSAQTARDIRSTAECLLGKNAENAISHLRGSLNRAIERNIPRDMHSLHLALAASLRALGQADEAAQHDQMASSVANNRRFALAG